MCNGTFMLTPDFGNDWLGAFSVYIHCSVNLLELECPSSSLGGPMAYCFAGYHGVSVESLQWQLGVTEHWHVEWTYSCWLGTRVVGNLVTECKLGIMLVDYRIKDVHGRGRHLCTNGRTYRPPLHLYIGVWRMHRMLMGLVRSRLIHPVRFMLPEYLLQPVAWYYGLTGWAIVGWSIQFLLCVHGPRFQNWNQGINMSPKVLKSKGSVFAYPNAEDLGKCNTFP